MKTATLTAVQKFNEITGQMPQRHTSIFCGITHPTTLKTRINPTGTGLFRGHQTYPNGQVGSIQTARVTVGFRRVTRALPPGARPLRRGGPSMNSPERFATETEGFSGGSGIGVRERPILFSKGGVHAS